MEVSAKIARALGLLLAGWIGLQAAPARAGWEYLSSEINDGNALLDVSMADERSACAVGVHRPGGGTNSEPLVLCTADGGASWRSSSLGSGGLRMPTAVYMVDAQVAFLAVLEVANFQMQTKMMRSDDGGRNWTEQALPGPPQDVLTDVYFTDADHGWTVGSAGAFYTVDGGTSWQAGTLPDLGADRSLAGVFFTDAQHGWLVGGFPGDDEQAEPLPPCCGFVLQSSDGGQSWQMATDGLAGGLNRIWFTDAQTGWAVGGGEAGLILHTVDGGQSWAPQTVPAGQYGAANFVADVVFPDADHGWAVGNIDDGSPMVLTTEDGGQQWTVDTSYDEAFAGLSGIEAWARFSQLLAVSFPMAGRGLVSGKNALLVGYSGGDFCADFDGDGHQDEACGGDDCDDQNAYIYPGAEELCNGLDENCDDQADETFDFDRDPNNCGECGFNCQPAQVCWGGECTMECPGELTRCGQECVDPSTDADHCGDCDTACAYDHAAAGCTNGACQMGDCLEGYVDLDGDPADGCEYACSLQGEETCNGQDDDCDGLTDEDLDDCQAQPDGGSPDGEGGDGSSGADQDEGPGGSGGCGCAAAGGGLGGSLPWLLVGLWLAWAWRRRVRA